MFNSVCTLYVEVWLSSGFHRNFKKKATLLSVTITGFPYYDIYFKGVVCAFEVLELGYFQALYISIVISVMNLLNYYFLNLLINLLLL